MDTSQVHPNLWRISNVNQILDQLTLSFLIRNNKRSHLTPLYIANVVWLTKSLWSYCNSCYIGPNRKVTRCSSVSKRIRVQYQKAHLTSLANIFRCWPQPRKLSNNYNLNITICNVTVTMNLILYFCINISAVRVLFSFAFEFVNFQVFPFKEKIIQVLHCLQ